MRYDWDEGKRRQNLREHGIDFAAVYQFNWDFAVRRVDDREDYGELREQAIGFIGDSLYMLVFTERTDDLGESDLGDQPAQGGNAGKEVL